jgi:hypothetical protein
VSVATESTECESIGGLLGVAVGEGSVIDDNGTVSFDVETHLGNMVLVRPIESVHDEGREVGKGIGEDPIPNDVGGSIPSIQESNTHGLSPSSLRVSKSHTYRGDCVSSLPLGVSDLPLLLGLRSEGSARTRWSKLQSRT